MSTFFLSNPIRSLLDQEYRPSILPFRGFANAFGVHIRGRVVSYVACHQPSETDSRRRNARTMLARFVSNAVPGATVAITYGTATYRLVADDHGYFDGTLPIALPQGERTTWHTLTYQVADHPEVGTLIATGEVMLPGRSARLAIVSDVDDTILVSHATATLKKVRTMLSENAHTRMPFEGVSDFYSQLIAEERNPMFFVSSSEWNLYDFLVDFTCIQELPKAPFLLKTLKGGLLDFLRSGGGSHDHKYEKIKHLMQTYTDLNFILIGDSGQHDAELYARVAEAFPKRVLAIYIRDVTKQKRDMEVQQIAANLPVPTTDMLLVPDTSAAEQHARAHGWVE